MKTVLENGTIEYRNAEGQFHREDGPAIEWGDGDNEWWLKGQLHREDGPAIEYSDDYKSWYLNGQLHREDGPAVEHSDGGKEWWLKSVNYSEEEFTKIIKETPMKTILQNGTIEYRNAEGQLHREDGPAVEWADGAKEWWLKGINYSEEEFEEWVLGSCVAIEEKNMSLTIKAVVELCTENELHIEIGSNDLYIYSNKLGNRFRAKSEDELLELIEHLKVLQEAQCE